MAANVWYEGDVIYEVGVGAVRVRFDDGEERTITVRCASRLIIHDHRRHQLFVEDDSRRDE